MFDPGPRKRRENGWRDGVRAIAVLLKYRFR